MGRHYPVYIACGWKLFGDCVCVNPMRFAVCVPVGPGPKAYMLTSEGKMFTSKQMFFLLVNWWRAFFITSEVLL